MVWLVVEIVVLVGVYRAFWLSKLKNRLALLEVPDNNFAVFGGARQDVGDHTVPRDRGDAVTFVEVGLARFELGGLLELADILNQNFAAARGQKVLFVRVEFKCPHWHAIMNLCRADTAAAKLLLPRVRL